MTRTSTPLFALLTAVLTGACASAPWPGDTPSPDDVIELSSLDVDRIRLRTIRHLRSDDRPVACIGVSPSSEPRSGGFTVDAPGSLLSDLGDAAAYRPYSGCELVRQPAGRSMEMRTVADHQAAETIVLFRPYGLVGGTASIVVSQYGTDTFRCELRKSPASWQIIACPEYGG